MRCPHAPWVILGLALGAAGAAGAAARAGQAAGAPPEKPAEPARVAVTDLPPALRLGARVNLIQRQVAVIPVLVVVSDERSFVAAVGAWRVGKGGAYRFPVLIDDGSHAARQRIARFVRAFRPETVVRFAAADDVPALPGDAAGRGRVIADAAAGTWGAASSGELGGVFRGAGFEPPGVVVAWPDDPAWPGALALAAGRGQPILWIKPVDGASVSGAWPVEEADKLARQIRGGLDELKWAYDAGGDAIEGVTLCLHVPVKIHLGPGDQRQALSVTDVIGRDSAEPRKARWAWAGQIFGGASASAYSAMCSLFLMPDRAWLFDSYDSGQPWVLWDMTETGKIFSGAGIDATVVDAPGGAGLDAWRRASVWGVEAGLIGVTTKGNADFFDLAQGQGRSVDVPLLKRPAAACFVHSWSANDPGNRRTIGAVWLERGAYIYTGSVHEPFLQAFVPTPVLARRLLAGFPWGAAVRIDERPAWKIATLGDPLMTLGPAGPRVSAPLPLRGVSELGDALPGLLKEKRFVEALHLLGTLARDADAARLVLALARDGEHPLTPEAGAAGLASAFFAGDRAALVAAGRAAAPILSDQGRVEREGLAELRDMLWSALGSGGPSAEEARVLASAIRPEVLARDVGEAAAALRRTGQEGLARALVDQALLNVKDRATADELERLKR
jgi:hypothetical protein